MKSEPDTAKLNSETYFSGGSVDLREKVDETSRDWILRALHLNNWNISAAARSLKVTRFGLQKMMKRLDISEKRQDAKTGQ
jgi:transcriptional regulator with GAF, ATPase, and Fis domain